MTLSPYLDAVLQAHGAEHLCVRLLLESMDEHGAVPWKRVQELREGCELVERVRAEQGPVPMTRAEESEEAARRG